MLPGIHSNIFNKKLQQIRTRIKEAKVDGYSKIRLSVSIGGVMTHNETIESAMYRADKLMLQAKSQQKGMVVTEENEFGVIDNESEVKDRQRVLVVDDSYMNRMILTEVLKSDYEIINAASGEECLEIIEKYGTGIDIILLDIVMPGMDGFQVLQKIREKNNVPVLMLTAKSDEEDKVSGLRLGADDYLTKPFGINELMARVNSLIRRYTTLNPVTGNEAATMLLKDMVIDKINRTVTVWNLSVDLTGKEFDLLLFLASNKGRVFTKKQLYMQVWTEEYDFDDNNLMAFISKLRKKIEPNPEQPFYIQTVRGVGYRFNKEA